MILYRPILYNNIIVLTFTKRKKNLNFLVLLLIYYLILYYKLIKIYI